MSKLGVRLGGEQYGGRPEVGPFPTLTGNRTSTFNARPDLDKSAKSDKPTAKAPALGGEQFQGEE